MRLVLLLALLPNLALAAPHADARRTDLVLEPVPVRLDGSPFLTLWDATNTEAWRWHFGAGLSQGTEPLRETLDGATLRAIIAHRRQLTTALSVGLPRGLQAGLVLPYLLDQEAEFPGSQMGRVAESGLIDASVWLKVSRALLADPWSTALVLTVDLPTGDSTAYNGRGAVAGALDAVLGWRSASLQASTQIGYRFEPARSLFNAYFDDHLRLAGGLRLAPKDVDWALISEVDMRLGGAPALAVAARVGVELRLGAVRTPILFEQPLSGRPGQPRWAAGGGVVATYKRPPDHDGDGLRGSDDQCPKKAEDKDGFEDADGCPDEDNDRDGIADTADKCPLQGEDKDGFEDQDGCPDDDNDQDGIQDRLDDCVNEPEDKDGHLDLDGCPDFDEDQDGIEDKDDACPKKPEDIDAFEDEDGCPDEDNDKDLVPDTTDKCPMVPENINQIDDEDGCPEPDADMDGILDPDDQCPKAKEDLDKWQDTDGCPDPDNDGDGLLDGDDDCPNEPETKNGVDDEDGCPEKAVLTRKRMKPHRIKARIHFRKHHWAIAKRSEKTIDLIAKLITEHDEIAKLRIEGHTDQSGRRRANRRLSQKRADEVRRALIARGIKPELLEAVGYGWSRPLDRRKNRRARRRNRRVGFLVLEIRGEQAKGVKNKAQEALDDAQP